MDTQLMQTEQGTVKPLQVRTNATLARVQHCANNIKTVDTIDLYKAKEDATWYGMFPYAGLLDKEICRRHQKALEQQKKPKPVMAGV